MRTTMSTLGRALVAGVLVAAGSVVVAAPVDAGALPTVLGQVACDPASGEQLITWTWQNLSGEALDFDSGTATPALTAGSLVSTVVGMQPATNLVDQTSATGETVASADAVGTVSVSVTFSRTVNQGTITATGSVLLFGDCVVDTTAPAVETTAPATTVAATTTVLLGSGSGNLPHAGGDDTLLWVACAFVVVGGALLLLRRRRTARPTPGA